MDRAFRKRTAAIAELVHSLRAFPSRFSILFIKALSVPFFHLAQPFRLSIDTGTSIPALPMAASLQNIQNYGVRMVHVKLNQRFRDVEQAHFGRSERLV